MKTNSLTTISIDYNFQNFYYLIDWSFKENLSLTEKKNKTDKKLPDSEMHVKTRDDRHVLVNPKHGGRDYSRVHY